MILELVQKIGYNKESSVVGHFGTKVYGMRQLLCREVDELCRISYIIYLMDAIPLCFNIEVYVFTSITQQYQLDATVIY